MRATALLTGLLLTALVAQAQQKFTISGTVKDATSGEALIGAAVFADEVKKGANTNTYGFYSLTLPAGKYTLLVRFIGMEELVKTIDLKADTKLDLELQPKVREVKEARVTGKKTQQNTESTDMGRIGLDVQKLNTLPALLGEVDILKTIQYLPGVKGNGEGNSGFYVRGGGPDQNLILLDEATVYNASHLFGFFSVFNADAVKNIDLIKGGMPANYGGRISSVLDINMKEGNDKGFHGQGGIGLIASRLTLEGPIVKDKGSFIVSGRRTYIDLLLKPFVNDTSEFSGTGYYFYDINAKANYRLGEKDRVYLSGYFGRDVFTFSNSNPGDPAFRIPWGNATVSARWNHVFTPKLFMNTTATFSDYNFLFDAEQDVFRFKLYSGIRDYSLKLDLSHYANVRHSLKYGGQYTRHIYTPSTVKVESDDVEFDIEEPAKLNAHEAAVYVLDDMDVTDLLRVNVGLRFTWFAHVGNWREYLYDSEGTEIGQRTFSSGDIIAQYSALEPRISARYKTGANSSVKASFNRGQQYVHLASFSGIALPTDVWVPSGQNVKPLVGTQYAVGYFKDWKDRMFETSVEAYYKTMDNLIEYAEGAEPRDNGNTNYDQNFVYGDGYSYGVELFVKKTFGKLNGWAGYTWSRTMRKFPELNNGNEFPSRWDRTHDGSLVLSYEHNERWSFGTTFTYSTGQAVTLPVNRYWVEGQLVSEYTERNGFRMAPYHRLDLSATLKNKPTRTKKNKETGEETEVKRRYRSSWTLAIYNVYNRRNPYFIYFANEGIPSEGTFEVTAKQVSLFSILPSITWNFEF
ncbi:MAG: TonB-dependent receptor [Flavobacteriales bacterium]|nr:MAG: TonB-dependent receptor [Flavobacteriales bacterium]